MNKIKKEVSRPIINSISGLSKTDHNIIEFINKFQEPVFDLTINDLAELSGTSVSGVSRFVKKYNFKNYQEFKVQVNLIIQKFEKNYTINNNDSFSTIISSHRFAIDSLYNEVVLEKIKEAAKIINQSNKILIQGSGSSKRISDNLYANILKIGKTPISNSDFHVFFPSISNCNSSDVLILFSNNLNTPEQIFSIQIAKENKVKIIVITSNEDNEYDQFFDVKIVYNKIHSSYIDVPLSSKLSQLLITDLLFQALILEDSNLENKLHNSRKVINRWLEIGKENISNKIHKK